MNTVSRLVTILILLAALSAHSAYRRISVPMPVTTAKAASWFNNQYGNWNWHQMKAGDLDGDGKLEFVLVNTQWEIFAVDDLGACTTAVNPASTLLWQMNNPAGNLKMIPDNPWIAGMKVWQGWHPQSFAVWDMDDDGKCEVIATWRLPDSGIYVCVFSGTDGRRIARSPSPIGTGWSSANSFNTGIANFSGDARPHDIYCFIDETGYVDAFHYVPGDTLLTLLWNHLSTPGKSPTDLTGHQGMPYDIDGDGRDEFMTNGALDHDGSMIFSLVNKHAAAFPTWGTYMHSDNSTAGDLIPDHPGIELLFAPCDDIPSVITDISGNILVNSRDSAFATFAHSETFNLGRFRKDLPGLQYACDPKYIGNIMITDAAGRSYARVPVGGMQASMDWDGDRSQDELLVMNESAVGVYQIKDTTYSATDFGYVTLVNQAREGYHQYNYPLPIDICGDYREEVVYNSYDSIIIIQNTDANPNGPYPSPTQFDTYMKRLTQQGFGAYAYYPYSEYASKILAVLTASLPTGEINTPYSARLLAAGGTGSYAWSLLSGTLPAGLALVANGTLSGTPTTTASAALRFRVNDGTTTIDTGYTLTVAPAPVVDSIRVTPVSVTLTALDTKALAVTVYFNNHTTSTDVTTCTWTSNNNSLVTVATGVVTGVAEGTTTVYASKGSINSNNVTVQVVPELPVDSIITLQQGLNSYAGCEDIMLSSSGVNMDGQSLQAGNKNSVPTANFLVRFDMSAIPSTTTVLACSLYVKCFDAGLSSANVSIYRVLRDWTEADATNTKATASVNWTSAFCLGDATDRATADKIDVTLPYATGWHGIDVTAMAQVFISGPSANKGFLVDFYTRNSGWGSGGYSQKEYRDSEYGTVADRPKLVIYPRSTTRTEARVDAPAVFSLAQNTPNPFNPSTRIAYGIPVVAGANSHVTLAVYDVRGNLVRTLVNEMQGPGYHRAAWNASACASGVYVCRAEIRNAGGVLFTATQKMLLMK